MNSNALSVLLDQVNNGQAAEALPELDRLHTQQPNHPGLLTVRAEALRRTGRNAEAICAYRQAAAAGGGVRNWLAAGILLAAERKTDESVQCLTKALEQTPDSEDVLDAIITTLFNGGRRGEGIDHARRQLAVSTNPTLMSRAALLLQANDLYDESVVAFKKIVALAPDDPALIGAALVPSRFTCEWEWIEILQQKIRAWYDQGNFNAPHEYPLTNVTWCANELWNLEVTRAYHARMVPRAEALTPMALPPAGRRIRVGYLSCDFRNHATMHLMAGVFEHHDRQRFEVFAYDYTVTDASDYRQRFLDAVEHHIPVHALSDRQAALRIAEDRLDVLFDLKLYTGNGRSGVMAHRPAALQATYLGFPGSAASPDIDYVVSDRFVTPDSSAPYYTEKFCRLPHSYQCNDRKRAAAAAPGTRAAYGLPEAKIVFGAFNQSYKIERGSFEVWMRILRDVPDSVLWLLGQSESARANLSRHAQQAGIDPARLVYASFADPREHLARLQLADAILDTLVCNGHTTTSDALWAGVPVVTARGAHFASRVSESLLNGVGIPELVGADADDMVRIATRIGTDPSYRQALRARVAGNRSSAPLFDTARFTRDFEVAVAMMVERQRSGLGLEHIDVPDQGPLAQDQAPPAFTGRVAGLQTAFAGCPLCKGPADSLGFADCTGDVSWHEPLPPTIEWLRCKTCSHIHTRHYWSESGRGELLRGRNPPVAAAESNTLQQQIFERRSVVAGAVRALGGYPKLLKRDGKPVWVDVGCGTGSLLMAASDHGFATVGVDADADAVAGVVSLGFSAVHQDFMQLRFRIVTDVLSLMQVLDSTADPRAVLNKAAEVLKPGAVLILSTPDASSSDWRLFERGQNNPYWSNPRLHHVFNRDGLIALVQESGFEVVELVAAGGGQARVELYAVRQ
ncbi:MAG TPA: methyltransferase domain-containing protein [Steroidobacteraceae bacterium]|nr:methyltransferase domain-containing protein [Steroidobacteraceae bacterium]